MKKIKSRAVKKRVCYYLQRGYKKKDIANIEKPLLDDVINFDYMGAAEFENGALYNSIHRIITGVYIESRYRCGLETFNIISKNAENIKEINEFIYDLCNGHEDLKFSSFINEKNGPCFWLAIDSDFMFWRIEDIFKEDIISQAIFNQQEKYLKNKKPKNHFKNFLSKISSIFSWK